MLKTYLEVLRDHLRGREWLAAFLAGFDHCRRAPGMHVPGVANVGQGRDENSAFVCDSGRLLMLSVMPGRRLVLECDFSDALLWRPYLANADLHNVLDCWL